MLSRRTRLIVAAVAAVIVVLTSAFLPAVGLDLGPLVVVFAVALAVWLALELFMWIEMRVVRRTFARVRAESGASLTAALVALGTSQRARLGELIGTDVPKNGQVIIAVTAPALQVWTAVSKAVPLISVPWQRLGPVIALGRSPLVWPKIEWSYVSNERIHGVAKLLLVTDSTDIATPRDAAEFVAALNAIRPPIV